MAKQIQIRRGTAAEHENFTGAVGEITMDTTNNTLRVHDGKTVGGVALARCDGMCAAIPNWGAGVAAGADFLAATNGVMIVRAQGRVTITINGGRIFEMSPESNANAVFSVGPFPIAAGDKVVLDGTPVPTATFYPYRAAFNG